MSIKVLIFSLLTLCCYHNIINTKEIAHQESSLDAKLFPSNSLKTCAEKTLRYHQIKFPDFQITIHGFELWDSQIKPPKANSDTAHVMLSLGQTIEGKTLSISLKVSGLKVSGQKVSGLKVFDKIEIYQRFENSITIMDEGPHCDLIDWKHYNSEWTLLKKENGKFKTLTYSENDKKKFVNTNMEEVISAVEKYCGKRWSEHAKKITRITEYPSGVGISRIFLKIKLEQSQTKKYQEKIISFEVPMGC